MRYSIMPYGAFVWLLTACAPPIHRAPPVHNVIFETPDARVELIGLKRWTLAMIQDSLTHYAPGQSLASHACAAILRGKLGFADAAVQYYGPGVQGNKKGYFAVPLIEPQDSALVRYRETPRDSLADRAEWSAAIEVLTKQNRVFQAAIQTPDFLLGRLHPDSLGVDLLPARPVLELLRVNYSAADRRLVYRTLTADANPRNRAIAALLMARFASADSAWLALADALRDRTGMVAATASQVLSRLAEHRARKVDWAPAAEGLRAILDGTSLFTQNTLLVALVATEVDPSLAPALLANGGDILLAKLRSEDARAADAVYRLFVRLSRQDYGRDADAWNRWLASL